MKKNLILALLFICLFSFQSRAEEPTFELDEEEYALICPPSKAFIGSWSRYRINFGMEKIHVRFPDKPYVTQENGLLTGSATHHQVLYKFIGYFPAVGNIDPHQFFKRELDFVNTAPFLMLGHTVYEISNGDWVLDYMVHDTFANTIIKHRSVVTPFNAYTLRAIFPNGYNDHFDYFCESFRIQCDYQ